MYPQLTPLAQAGNGAWQELAAAKRSRYKAVIAVVGAGTAFIRHGAAGAGPNAGLPITESMGWVTLDDLVVPGIAARSLWVIAPVGMIIRGFAADLSVLESA